MDELGSAAPCPLCLGVGWLRRDVPVEHPDFGKLEQCACLGEQLAAKRWREGVVLSGMGQGLARQTFGNFRRERQPVAYELALEFVADLGARRWLAFLGGTGTGKSHLLAAICNGMIDLGRQPLYWLVSDLVIYLQAGYGAGDFPERLARIKDADVLLLDEYDIGLGQDQGARERARDRDEKMFSILNHRLNHALPVALATNGRLEQFPPRLASRLSDATLVDAVTMRSGDYRLEK
jgi:DNA replication protein DnaC